jgi:hypothetical protein
MDFHYLAGQYVNIALVKSGTGRDEYHPFTLTSGDILTVIIAPTSIILSQPFFTF